MIELLPLISAGQQEFNLRGGTSNVCTNIVFAKTLRLILEEQQAHFDYVSRLNKRLRKSLKEENDILINSDIQGSPYILNVSARYVGSEILLNALNERGFAVSAKSTCASKVKQFHMYSWRWDWESNERHIPFVYHYRI